MLVVRWWLVIAGGGMLRRMIITGGGMLRGMLITGGGMLRRMIRWLAYAFDSARGIAEFRQLHTVATWAAQEK